MTEGCVGRKTTSEVRTRAKDGRGTRVNDIVEAVEKERGSRKIPKTRIVRRKKRVRPSILEWAGRKSYGPNKKRSKRSKEGLYIALEGQIWGANRVVESQERVLAESNEPA